MLKPRYLLAKISVMKAFIKAHKFLVIIIFSLVVLSPLLVFAIDTISEGYRVAPGQTKAIHFYGVNSTIPYHLTNRSADKTYFIPTRTTREANVFQAAKLPETQDASYYDYGSDLVLEDFCGNGLCSLGGTYDYEVDLTQKRIYNDPTMSGMVFGGYLRDAVNADYYPVPVDSPEMFYFVENGGPNNCCTADCGPVCCGDGVCDAFYSDAKPYIHAEYYENFATCPTDCKKRCTSVDYNGCIYHYTGSQYMTPSCNFSLFHNYHVQTNGFLADHTKSPYTLGYITGLSISGTPHCGLSGCTVDCWSNDDYCYVSCAEWSGSYSQ